MAHKTREKTLFEKFSDVMDQNTKGVQIGCYSVAFIGLTFALRRVRPFTRFKKPSDIPNHFIKERRELIGTVERVEPNGVLIINHKPLIALPGIKDGELPTKIANIEIGGHGVSWLQILVAGNEVKFTPIAKRDQFVECQFKLHQTTHDKKPRVIDLGVSLVSIGFGNLIESPIGKKDKDYRYYTELIYARERALRKKMGFKYYIKPTKLILAMISRQISIAMNLLMQRFFKKTSTKVPNKAIAAA
ncbi:protein c3orf33 [Holotrichia oblita]|uniref:Protein c3orf33 n=1 Tax=Holotrichia oblita TaxID=644536 RepID=A0ACB9TQ35_HOLOL|nr:protein c3orf33 [Holotrichia oblita]